MAIQVKKATPRDLPKLAELAGQLVRQHFAFDPKRFLFIDNPEKGYAWWFAKELANPKALILSAKLDGEIVGYAYARLEPRDWNALLDAHGALHDILVADSARRRGIGKLLLERVLAELKQRGAPRVLLHTAIKNRAAQKLFASVGFRQTMLEMTCELDSASSGTKRKAAKSENYPGTQSRDGSDGTKPKGRKTRRTKTIPGRNPGTGLTKG